MSREKVIKKEKELVVEVFKDSMKEKEATPHVEKSVPPLIKEYAPQLPYPSWLKSDSTDEQFRRFLDSLKQLYINVSFVVVLS